MQEHDLERDEMTADERGAPDGAPATGETEATAAASDGGSVGNRVLDILSDVEQQFDRLRQVQRDHESQIVSLEERAHGLELAEREVQEELSHARKQRAAAEQERHELETERERLESDLQTRQEQLEARDAALAEQTDRLAARREESDELRQRLETERAELERTQKEFEELQQDQLGELQTLEESLGRERAEHETARAEAEAELERRRSELEERVAEVAAQREAIEAERAELQQREQELLEHRAGFEEDKQRLESSLAERESSLERDRSELSEREQALGERQTALETLQGELREQQAELEARTSEIESERADLQERLADLSGRLAKSEQELGELEQSSAAKTAELELQLSAAQAREAQIEQDRDDARAGSDSLVNRMAELESNLEHRDEQLSDAEGKLALAGERLSKFANILSEQAPLLERGSAAVAMVEHQRNQIEQLTAQIAESTLGADAEEIRRKDERIGELTEALRQARGQSAGQTDTAEMERRVAELLTDVDRLRLEAERSRIEAAQAKRQLEERVEETVHEELSEAAVAEHEAKTAELVAEVERLQVKLQNAEQGAREGVQRINVLEQQIVELAQTQPGGDDGEEASSQGMDELRDKARRVNAVAEHLRRRHERLRKMQHMIRDGKGSRSASRRGGAPNANRHSELDRRAAEVRELDEQRKQLSEVRAVLAVSEQAMIRRWARPRAVSTVVWLFLLAAVTGAGSWFLTGYMFPAEIAASVALEASTRSGMPLEPEQAEKWMAWHTETLDDARFHNLVAKRLEENRLDDYRTKEAVAARLAGSLHTEATKPDLLTLTLTGRRKAELTAVLDVLATTLASESTRQLGKRSDGARAVILGERKDGGLVRYASVRALPINDDRLLYFGPVYGVLFVLSLAVIGMIYTRLVRAKRVFDEESAIIDAGEVVAES